MSGLLDTPQYTPIAIYRNCNTRNREKTSHRRRQAGRELDEIEPTSKKSRAEIAAIDDDKAKTEAEKKTTEEEAAKTKKERGSKP